MTEDQRKYLHLRMLIKDIEGLCYKIRLHTECTKNLKGNMSEIETITSNIELKIKEAIEREVLFS